MCQLLRSACAHIRRAIKKKGKKDDNKYYIEEGGRNLEHSEHCVRNSANCPGNTTMKSRFMQHVQALHPISLATTGKEVAKTLFLRGISKNHEYKKNEFIVHFFPPPINDKYGRFIVYSSPESINLLTCISARACISKAKMNENDENVVPMRDAAPDVEHLRLEISENREVFYRIDDVTLMMFRRCQQLLFSCFFFEQERKTGREGEGSFLFFSKWFSSRQLGFWCSFLNKRKTINNKISLGQFIVYWQFSTSRKRQSVQSAKCSKCLPKTTTSNTSFLPPKKGCKKFRGATRSAN